MSVGMEKGTTLNVGDRKMDNINHGVFIQWNTIWQRKIQLHITGMESRNKVDCKQAAV